MKIAQINSVFNSGSTGRIAYEIHEKLLKEGHESKVFYGRGKKNSDPNIIKISNAFSNYFDVFKTRLLNLHSESNRINTILLINEIKKFNPDIIHLHNIHGYYLNYELLFNFFRKSKIPIVWLLHDQWATSGNAAYFNQDIIDWKEPDPEYVKKLSKEYPRHIYLGKDNIKRVYERKKTLFNIENLILVTPSRWLELSLSKTFFKNKTKYVINNGIDLTNFKASNDTKLRNKKIILGVANKWDARKGLNYFIKLSEYIDSNTEIILIGVDNKTSKKLPRNIVAIERTDSLEELVKYYNMADLLVNPTLEDNFPTVNIEAQACGTPVITFDTGGSGESVIEGITGSIIEQGNFKQLLDSIDSWPLKNEKTTIDCVRNAQKYSSEVMVDNYMKLYNDLI